MKMDPTLFYQQLVYQMDEGFKRDVLRVLLFHKGEEHAIRGEDLVQALSKDYPDNKDLRRRIRYAVQEMRDEGLLIACGPTGFFLPVNRSEFDKYIDHEYRSKIKSMNETVAAQVTAADEILGREHQRSLFNA